MCIYDCVSLWNKEITVKGDTRWIKWLLHGVGSGLREIVFNYFHIFVLIALFHLSQLSTYYFDSFRTSVEKKNTLK